MTLCPFQTAEEVAGGAEKTAVAAAANTAKVARGFAILGMALGALGIVLDGVTLAITANDLHNGSKAELAAKMREAANLMENQLKEFQKLC